MPIENERQKNRLSNLVEEIIFPKRIDTLIKETSVNTRH